MQASRPRFEKYLFVCENKREEGACCNLQGIEIRELLKNAIKEKGLSEKIRVSRTGCLDVCAEGPNVLLMPDNIWFKQVKLKDLNEIIQKAVEDI